MIKYTARILETKEEFQTVHALLVELFERKSVSVIHLPNEIDFDLYYYIKSHRSSVTEGNTTSLGEFTELVREYEKCKVHKFTQQ